MGQLYIIPDQKNIIRSREQAEKWNAAFEYNDFFQMKLMDDKERLAERIRYYKDMQRDRSKDTLHGAFFDLCINSQDKKIAELSKYRMRQSMDVAEQLQLKGVVFHTNFITGFSMPGYIEHWLECSEEFYRKLASEYQGLEIYMENMFDKTPDTLAKLAKRMQDVKSFGICLDVAHANVSDAPIEAWIEQLAPYIRHQHINDNDGRSDLHMAVGQGCINWQMYQSMMKQYAIESSVLLEVSTCEAAQESYEYMREKGIYPLDGDRNV